MKKHRTLNQIKRQRQLLLMCVPGLVYLLMFTFLPLSGWYMAFSNYKLSGGLFDGAFVGLKHFKRIVVESGNLRHLLENTLIPNVIGIFLSTVCPMLLAILFNEIPNKTFKKIVQSVSFFPYFISWVIVYTICNALLAVNSGILNQTMIKLGLIEKGINFLGDPKYAWGLHIIVGLWKSVGYGSIVYLAGISGIPAELYEAAALDGASRFQRHRYITLPQLAPTACILLIMSVGGLLGSDVSRINLFYNSTNWTKLETLDMYIYKYGLGARQYSFGTAVTIVMAIVGIALVLIANKIVKRINDVSLI